MCQGWSAAWRCCCRCMNAGECCCGCVRSRCSYYSWCPPALVSTLASGNTAPWSAVQQLHGCPHALVVTSCANCPFPCPQLWLLGCAPPAPLLVLLLLASRGAAMNAALLRGSRGKASQLAAAWQLWRGVLGAVGFAALPQVSLVPARRIRSGWQHDLALRARSFHCRHPC